MGLASSCSGGGAKQKPGSLGRLALRRWPRCREFINVPCNAQTALKIVRSSTATAAAPPVLAICPRTATYTDHRPSPAIATYCLPPITGTFALGVAEGTP